MNELQEAHQRVTEITALIEIQRQLIEKLDFEGDDTTSAHIVLDSLRLSLSLSVKERARLRSLQTVVAA